MNTTKVLCEVCKEEFTKLTKEVNRNLRMGVPHICSKKECRSEWGRITVKRRKFHNGGMSAEWMKQISPSKRDEFSPFRNLLHKIRNRKGGNQLTVNDLKNLWENQSGKCAITKLPMILPETSACTNLGPKCVSIDRIDNSKGYSVDNIQLVCYSVNLARNKFSILDIQNFFYEIGGLCQHLS